MRITENYIHIGINIPFSVLHASDTHLTLADARDDERKILLAENRAHGFRNASKNLELIKDTATSENLTVIYTGDLIDFVSEMNLDTVKDFTDKVDVFMAAGNHEFSLYVGEAKEDAAYRNQSLNKVQALFKNNIRFSSREINGVLFVALDNSYYLIDDDQFKFLIEECNKGLPVILCVHTPLFTEELYEYTREGKSIPAYLMSVPEELMRDYSEDRYLQQKEDAITSKAYDFIVNCDAIKVIITGHIHKDYVGEINGKIQIATGTDTLRKIYFD